ncbi:MAG: FACT complex subunit, partial [Paramarteilia canceri]
DLLETMKKKNKMLSNDGDVLVKLMNAMLLAPRGKYIVNFLEDKLRLSGKTFDHAVAYENIVNVLFLETKVKKTLNILMQLNTPLKQNQTYYEFLCFQFQTDAELSLEISSGNLESWQSKLEGFNSTKETLSNTKILQWLFENIANKDIITQDQRYEPATVTIKTTSGTLFFLQNGIAFVPKFYFYLQFDKIALVSELRVSNDNKFFDISIKTTDKTEYILTNILISHQADLFEFFANNGVSTVFSEDEDNAPDLNLDEDLDEDEQLSSSSENEDDDK